MFLMAFNKCWKAGTKRGRCLKSMQGRKQGNERKLRIGIETPFISQVQRTNKKKEDTALLHEIKAHILLFGSAVLIQMMASWVTFFFLLFLLLLSLHLRAAHKHVAKVHDDHCWMWGLCFTGVHSVNNN